VLNWVRNTWNSVTGTVASGVDSAIQAVISALAGLIDTVFGHVYGAWEDLATDLEHAARFAETHALAIYHQLYHIITHDIPLYAYTAYWWVTHPASLAHVLFWHVIRELEDNAFTAARYLGSFLTGLIWHNLRLFISTVEDILDAVL